MSKRKKKKPEPSWLNKRKWEPHGQRAKWQRQNWYEKKSRELRTLPSPAEAALWEYLKTQKTGHLFHWNYAYPPYILDFVCFNSALIVEVDGEFHANRAEADEERDRFFTRKGAKVLRFMAKDVMRDPQAIACAITKVCLERHGIPSAL